MRDSGLNRIGTLELLIGAALVGAAIAMDSDAGRIVNGVGGIAWFSGTALLTLAAARRNPPGWLWLALAGLTISVAFVVKPSAAVPAIVGFVPAGFLMGVMAPSAKLWWAALVPAWYLPAHIGTAILKSAINSALGNEATLRTDPPPTAAIVPLLMVVCALAGGYLASRLDLSDRIGQRGAGLDLGSEEG